MFCFPLCNQTYTFSNAGASGRFDPTQTQLISIYPNPNNGVFFIDSKTPVTSVLVHEQTGRLMGSFVNDEMQRFNLTYLPGGIYFVVVQFSDNATVRTKVIIAR